MIQIFAPATELVAARPTMTGDGGCPCRPQKGDEMGNSTWSDELQASTRALLANPPVTLGASVCVKNIDGRFGAMQIFDLLVYRWAVAERGGKVHHYGSIADLLRAGWAID